MSAPLRLRCPAKINLGLEVAGTRPDGFHEIRTIFQSIDLADELWVEEAPEGGLEVEVEGAELPPGRGNLVYRAAEALRKRAGIRRGARLKLRKRVPIGAGLGGGSSDAAVALMGLDRLWDLGLGIAGLSALAGELGSDVPFFLHGGTCLGLGRGEKLFPVEAKTASAADFLVACPAASLSTAQVYADWDATLTTPAGKSRLSRFLASALTGQEEWSELANDLEGPAIRRVQAVATLKTVLEACGARAALMSGSGPSVFGVFFDPQKVEEAARRLGAEGYRVHRCQALSRAKYRDYIGLFD